MHTPFSRFWIVLTQRREALGKLPWLRPALIVGDVILLTIDLFVPLARLIRILLGLGAIAANEFFTPIIVKRIVLKDLEGILSCTGDLEMRVIRPLPLEPAVLAQHKQLSGGLLCIPMAVEFVLKLLGRMPPDVFPLQENWHQPPEANFGVFDGQIFEQIRFDWQFSQATHPRGDDFPLDDLFIMIENELSAGRYVIVALSVPGGWHNYVIYAPLPGQEFAAVTKGRTPEQISDVRQRIGTMKGTDILTYQ